MLSKAPFLFIDVPHGREALKGTSFYNIAEVETIVALKNFCLQKFAQNHAKRSENPEASALMKFTKNSMYVITPYNAQKNAIAEYFADEDIDD